MAKGIIYVMTTVVPGLIKIGKTGSDSFEQRMYNLESNGYRNVVGLKRKFAIEVDDYDEKENLLDDIFSKSRVPNTELFALDINLVIQLLSSFEGTQVYPEKQTKDEAFDEATEKVQVAKEGVIPNGRYYLNRKLKRNNNEMTTATMIVKDGDFIIPEGTVISESEAVSCPIKLRQLRSSDAVKNNIVQKDCVFASPSTAASFVIGGSTNGWIDWCLQDGTSINIFRH